MVGDRRLLAQSADPCFRASPHFPPPLNFLLPPPFLSCNGQEPELAAAAGSMKTYAVFAPADINSSHRVQRRTCGK